jgi:hypothetical protein
MFTEVSFPGVPGARAEARLCGYKAVTSLASRVDCPMSGGVEGMTISLGRGRSEIAVTSQLRPSRAYVVSKILIRPNGRDSHSP